MEVIANHVKVVRSVTLRVALVVCVILFKKCFWHSHLRVSFSGQDFPLSVVFGVIINF